MKKLAVLITALALSTPVLATDGLFIGAGLGNSKLSFDYNDTFFDVSGSDSKSDTALYFRAGKLVRDDVRAYADLTKVSYDSVSQLSLTASLDKLFPIADQVNLYAGGSLGFVTLDLDGASDETGLLYGVQGGAIFSANENIEIDFGLSYLLTSAKFKESDTFFGVTYTNEVDFTDLMTFRVGVNYYF